MPNTASVIKRDRSNLKNVNLQDLFGLNLYDKQNSSNSSHRPANSTFWPLERHPDNLKTPRDASCFRVMASWSTLQRVPHDRPGGPCTYGRNISFSY